ncbi:hypothetical protein F4809DRAFT_663283 [Biscogniauxia mediterranea]|nr:hypothetical protein F4809DRAFT_663283 [Biscogniauxia mediterranea]
MATTPGTTNDSPGDRRLVVGIDFGTTYSGVAWAETGRSDRNVAITQWPRGLSSPKVPTTLRYLNDTDFEWGSQIPPEADPSSIVSAFKLALEPDGLRRAPEAFKKSLKIEKVDQKVTDYLSGLMEHFMRVLQKQVGQQIINGTAIQFVLTVPAIWSDRAKQRTAQAFQRIKNLPNNFTISLVTEPEAAATAALKELDRHGMKVGDSFVIVDCGGGTVDLITYTVTSLFPVLQVDEATEGTGGFCGSNQINDRFRQFLTARLGKEEGWDEEVLRDATERFDMNIKRRFNLSSVTQNETFSIQVAGIALNQKIGVNRNGRFTLRAADVHMFFEPDILRIIQLVKEQIALSNVSIRSILLVGGFGSSTYLRERLELAINEGREANQAIEILQPPDAWLAVVKGAVMRGVSQVQPENYDVPIIRARTARKHYGYVFGIPFDEKIHASMKQLKYWDNMDGLWRVQAMQWHIKRGEHVPEDKPFTQHYSIARPVLAGPPKSTSLVVYADDKSPEAPIALTDNVKILCNLTADLSKIPVEQLDQREGNNGNMWYELNFAVEAIYRSASTEYSLIYKGQRYDTVTAEYV